MRGTHCIVPGAVLGAIVWGVASAAQAMSPAIDCQRMGGEVSALIDSKKASPNIAAARARFQAGIMDCMEGNDAAANKNYSEAQRLLMAKEKVMTVLPRPVPRPPVPVQVADCQKLGGEVSALIDARRSSQNIAAARAVFQAGIMDCMEGDDASANKHYLEAKTLLADRR